MKHTPGSWEVVYQQKPGSDGYYRYQILDQAGTILAKGNVDGILPTEERLANFKLMAAAPDLLEALKGLVKAKKMASKNPEGVLRTMEYRWESAAQAIAKAEGES